MILRISSLKLKKSKKNYLRNQNQSKSKYSKKNLKNKYSKRLYHSSSLRLVKSYSFGFLFSILSFIVCIDVYPLK